MRAGAALIILLLATCALAASLLEKPIEPPMAIDAQSPGAWPQDAAANRVDMIDQHSCTRLIVPYQITTEPRKGITYT